MRRVVQMTMGLVLLAALAACGSRSENQTAAENVAGTVPAARTSDPFADAEQKMNQAMMSAAGTDVGDNWVKKMIAHHQGAIDMSQIILNQNPKPDVAEMAKESIDKQRMDIADLQKLEKKGTPDQRAAELYRQAMMDMQQKMQAVTGSDINEMFMRKMLEHHRGAIAMSDIALKNGVSGALRQQVQKTRDDQQKDAKMVEAMLAGQSMQQAMKSSGAMTAAEMSKMPKPTDRSAHDMNNMGNMDMNGMAMNRM